MRGNKDSKILKQLMKTTEINETIEDMYFNPYTFGNDDYLFLQ
jgi:hypothetical protein